MNEINYDANSVLLFFFQSHQDEQHVRIFLFVFFYFYYCIWLLFALSRFVADSVVGSAANTPNAIAIHRSSQIIMRFHVHFVSITHRAQYSFQAIVYIVVVLNYAVTFDSAQHLEYWLEQNMDIHHASVRCDGDAHKNRFSSCTQDMAHVYDRSIHLRIHIWKFIRNPNIELLRWLLRYPPFKMIEIHFRMCMWVTESIEHMGASCDDSVDSHITIHSKATSFCVLLYVVCISFAVHAPLTHILKHTKPSFTLFYFPLIPFTHSLEPCARARTRVC